MSKFVQCRTVQLSLPNRLTQIDFSRVSDHQYAMKLANIILTIPLYSKALLPLRQTPMLAVDEAGGQLNLPHHYCIIILFFSTTTALFRDCNALVLLKIYYTMSKINSHIKKSLGWNWRRVVSPLTTNLHHHHHRYTVLIFYYNNSKQ